MKFRNAIVRIPSPSMVHGISGAGLGEPDYEKAVEQHHGYIEALGKCGLEVLQLEASDAYPDAVFIEDVALLTSRCAILTRPGAPSRRGEIDLVREAVESRFNTVYEVSAPGCVEAGDIMRAGSHYYIGLSGRTNREGASQVIDILDANGYSGSLVKMDEFLHLKSGLSYLEENRLLVSGEFTGRDEFDEFEQIPVPEEEQYAANSLWINGTVLTPAGFAQTASRIAAAGYDVMELDMSEFRKLDGGLSCLSLRF